MELLVIERLVMVNKYRNSLIIELGNMEISKEIWINGLFLAGSLTQLG